MTGKIKTHGGKRAGAGRKRAEIEAATQRARFEQPEQTEAYKDLETPLEYMLEVMRNPQIDARRRDQMAAAAAPYVHHRLSSTEHSGPGGGTVQVIVKTGFAYDDDDGVKNGPEKPAGADGA